MYTQLDLSIKFEWDVKQTWLLLPLNNSTFLQKHFLFHYVGLLV